jgi:internalin A
MKKLVIHIVCVLMSMTGFAQTASIPDPNFFNFLKNNYPQTINASDQLIISAAAQITGTISCGSLSITNLEGIQYFSQIIKFSAIHNDIVSIPSLLPMTNLESVHLYDNKLIAVPSFVGMQKLKTVLLYDNQLTQMPLFGNNPIIEEIIISRNNISTISSLSDVPSLLKLDIGENKLTMLPDVSSNINLKELICWSNKLTTLPSLHNLASLTRLNAGKNKLNQTPDLSGNPLLSILALDNNLLTTMPNIIGFSNLTSVKIYNNYLTFEDLLPYASMSNFSSVYTYSPMLTVKGDTVDAYYDESIVVHSNIDTVLTNVTYDWYEGVTSIGSSLLDAVSIIQASGAGISVRYVYVKLTHAAFPNLILKSDSIVVNFNPCPVSANVSYVTLKKECSNVGEINISVQGYVAPNTNYTIKSISFGSSENNASGFFMGLIDTAYALKINFSSTCILNYTPTLKLPIESCKDVFITPNNDGDMDTYLITGSGSAVIYDKNGNVVKMVTLPYVWDGSGKQGIVAPGYYIVVVNGGNDRITISVLY